MMFASNAIMSSNLVLISETETVEFADNLMKKNKIRHLPVVDSKQELSGIITSTDVAKTINKKKLVKTVMSPHIRIIKSDASILKIISQMLKFKISSMLVAKKDNVVGIVTTDDLIQLLYELIDEGDDLVIEPEDSVLIERDWDDLDENTNEDLHEVKQNLLNTESPV